MSAEHTTEVAVLIGLQASGKTTFYHQTRVPDVGLYATLKRLWRPRPADGFDELFTVRTDGRGGFDVRAMENEE